MRRFLLALVVAVVLPLAACSSSSPSHKSSATSSTTTSSIPKVTSTTAFPNVVGAKAAADKPFCDAYAVMVKEGGEVTNPKDAAQVREHYGHIATAADTAASGSSGVLRQQLTNLATISRQAAASGSLAPFDTPDARSLLSSLKSYATDHCSTR